MVALVLRDLLCGRPTNDTRVDLEGQDGAPWQEEHRAWNERLAAHEVPQVAASILDMACNKTNRASTTVEVHRLMVGLARSAPQAWVQVILPPLLDLQRLALPDAHEAGSLEAV